MTDCHVIVSQTWCAPVPGGPASGFRAPAEPWGPGHRGVDLPVAEGQPIRAMAAGRIAFVGQVAGVPVVTVVHGALRSTYQPVRGLLPVGTEVRAGEVIAVSELRVDASGGHCASACLHLGLIAGERYLDPAAFLTGRAVLKPLSGPAPR